MQLSAEHAGVGEKCREMGDLLGLGEPVREEVLYGALEDESYAHNLLVSRRHPAFLTHLLKNPPPTARRQEPSNFALVQRAAMAMWAWARTGFATVDDATFENRYGTCQQCPHLQAKPDKLLHKIAGGEGDGKVCGLCGCPALRKARLATEACPDPHPTKPGLNRWEQPIG